MPAVMTEYLSVTALSNDCTQTRPWREAFYNNAAVSIEKETMGYPKPEYLLELTSPIFGG